MNMAIDELLIEESDLLGVPILRFYSWNSKCMSIGYIQKYSSTFREGYSLVRRPTGGGTVYHDIDMTYTISLPSCHIMNSLSREESYSAIHNVIVKALETIGLASKLFDRTPNHKNRFSMQCFSAPVKFDIASIQGNSIKKIAGAAQRRTRRGILHQGSIVLDNIQLKRERLICSIISSFEADFNAAFTEFNPGEDFLKKADLLAKNKYALDSWNKLR